uniref:Claudin 23a n=1 Tax=Neogobius melanostomus TaxID=47308 RepID=A0A8C6V5T4_9GOBI
MPNQQEWIRRSLRTPGIFIFGMILSPCGWVLDLTATVAPNWRTLHNLPNSASGFTVLQGIWDICTTTSSTSTAFDCGQKDTGYFNHQIIKIAQGLMVASLVVTLVGLAVAIPGVRCWKNTPNWTVAGLGGLGYCIILGYIGGIMEVLAGFVMFIGIRRCCGGKNRGEVRVEHAVSQVNRQKEPPRRRDVPSLSRPRSEANSVAYSKDYDDVSFPRAKRAAPSLNPMVSSKPYDADF